MRLKFASLERNDFRKKFFLILMAPKRLFGLHKIWFCQITSEYITSIGKNISISFELRNIPQRGVETLIFFSGFKVRGWHKIYCGKLLLGTLMRIIIDSLRSSEHPRMGGWNRLIFLEFKVRRLHEILFPQITSRNTQSNEDNFRLA